MGHGNGLPVFLRAPRTVSLWLVGVLITVASVVAFALSYHGLFDWALHHQWPTSLAVWFPFLVDVLIVVAEVILFVAAIDGGTPLRVRAAAWSVLLVFTGLSVAGNATHVARADLMARAGFALPPLVLAVALGFGLGELKRQMPKYRPAVTPRVTPWKPDPITKITGDEHCSPKTAQLVQRREKAAVRAFERSRGGQPNPAPAPAARDATAAPSPSAAVALNGRSHG